MIPAGDQWGPFAPDLDSAERRARLRSLRALARVYAGPRALTVCQLLAQAETDADALEPASVEISRLAPSTVARSASIGGGEAQALAEPPVQPQERDQGRAEVHRYPSRAEELVPAAPAPCNPRRASSEMPTLLPSGSGRTSVRGLACGDAIEQLR